MGQTKEGIQTTKKRRWRNSFSWFKRIVTTLILGSFIYITLALITFFSIESERDGLFVSFEDPKTGTEESSGLLLLLLIFPTIFFCFIPFTWYDFLPFIFMESSLVILDFFQRPPARIWYISILFCTAGFLFNISTATYFFKRDPIPIFALGRNHVAPFLSSNTHCQAGGINFLPESVRSIFCNQYNLKIGAGRIYFKEFVTFGAVISAMVYCATVMHIFGIRRRSRIIFKDWFNTKLIEKLSILLQNCIKKNHLKCMIQGCKELSMKQLQTLSILEEQDLGESCANLSLILTNGEEEAEHSFEKQVLEDDEMIELVKDFHRLSTMKFLLKKNEKGITLRKTFFQLPFYIVNFFSSLSLTIGLSVLTWNLIDLRTCPQSFNNFLAFRGQCYQISESTKTWVHAQSECNKNHESMLLEIYSKSELAYTMNVLRYEHIENHATFWLGASNHMNSNLFVWNSTGKEPSYNIPWAPGFPYVTSSRITCISILSENDYVWLNQECYEQSYFICKMVLKKSEQHLDDNSKDIDGKKVHVLEDHKLLIPWAQEAYGGKSDLMWIKTNVSLCWNEARDYCKKYDMDLVYLDTESKWKFILEQLRQLLPKAQTKFHDYRIWIGAFRDSSAKSQYEFEWVNGYKENLEWHVWQINEEMRKGMWSPKCLSIHIRQRRRHESKKKFLYLTSCDEKSFFDDIVCEKQTFKKNQCLTNSDCHNLALCIRGLCLCKPGFAGNGNLCFDINECHKYSIMTDSLHKPSELVVHECVDKEICVNVHGSYNCSICPPWKRLLLWNNKCASSDFCDPETTDCLNMMGTRCIQKSDSYTCVCREGFSSNGVICLANIAKTAISNFRAVIDITNWYDSHKMCIMEGGYFASFEKISDWELMSKAVKSTIRQLQLSILNPHVNTEVWLGGKKNFNGSFEWYSSKKMIDYNLDTEDETKDCVKGNLDPPFWKSYQCYVPLIGLCQIPSIHDPCEQNSDCLDNNSECRFDHHHNAMTCICDIGYFWDTSLCIDINECIMYPNICHIDAFCINKIGSYACYCKDGYTGDGSNCFKNITTYENSKYFLNKEPHSSCLNENEKCKVIGGTLASYESPSEWKFIRNIMRYNVTLEHKSKFGYLIWLGAVKSGGEIRWLSNNDLVDLNHTAWVNDPREDIGQFVKHDQDRWCILCSPGHDAMLNWGELPPKGGTFAMSLCEVSSIP